MSPIKKIAALTMVRNDNFFLEKWVSYYGDILGRENLFVFFDGNDQKIPSFCEGVNSKVVEKIGNNVRQNDRLRLLFLSEQAKELFATGYDIIIGGDADEYLAVDPLTGMGLQEYLSQLPKVSNYSGLGLDVGQKLGAEKELSLEEPFLMQRHYAQISSRYTKASVLMKPCLWGSGFHRVKGHNFHIAPNLYLFHFGFSDMAIIQRKLSDSDKLQQGWERHLKKRSRTIRLVTEKKALDFERWEKRGRIIQSLFRPIYAWNKPSMLMRKIIVKIPQRFDKLL